MRVFDEVGRVTPEACAEEAELQQQYQGYQGVDEDYVHAGSQALERWWDRKFGIQICWGIYSMIGNGPEVWPLAHPEEYGLGTGSTFRAQYEELYKTWNPSGFNADEWCNLFQRAGIRFLSFTTKHHDGFSMYDTKTRVKRRRAHVGPDAGKIIDCDLAYSIMETPFRRDVVRELVTAGKARGMGISLFFSHIDWFDSDFRIDEWNYQHDLAYSWQSDPQGFNRMIARHRQQLQELCSNYGPLDQISFGKYFPENGQQHGIREALIKTVKMIRRLQPQVLLRDCGIEPYGDFCILERTASVNPNDSRTTQGLPWNAVLSGGRHSSYAWGGNYKTASWVIENLIDIVAKGGNFQVAFGPSPAGRWDQEVARILEEVGAWLGVNGEGIYATRPCRVFHEGPNIRYTRSKDGQTVYAFLTGWQDSTAAVRLTAVRAKNGSAIKMLGLDRSLKYRQDNYALTVEIPDWFADPAQRPCQTAYVLKIQVADQEPITSWQAEIST